jgi:hypothetical protein
MKPANLASKTLLFLSLATVSGVVGCNFRPHPDDQAAVYQVLDKNDLGSVEVLQNRLSGVITLKGIVGDAQRKSLAESLVQQTAPGYTINDQIKVNNTGVLSLAKPAGNAPASSNPPSTREEASARRKADPSR